MTRCGNCSKISAFGLSVRGASHRISGQSCQDSCGYLQLPGGLTVAAVSDGHGSSQCPYSHAGAVLACAAFCQMMAELAGAYGYVQQDLFHFLQREGQQELSRRLLRRWRIMVHKLHRAYRRPIPEDPEGKEDHHALLRLYGCTLLGLVLGQDEGFAWQLGDGDIILSDEDGSRRILPVPQRFGVDTDSLCMKDAWTYSYAKTFPVSSGKARLYTLTTDGFANSYVSDEDFLQTCSDYYLAVEEYGFSRVCGSLRQWLTETTEGGCGDDVTMVMCYPGCDASAGEAGTVSAGEEQEELQEDDH